MFFILASLIILLLNALVSKLFVDQHKNVKIFTICLSVISMVMVLFSSLKFLVFDINKPEAIWVLPWTILSDSLEQPLFEMNALSAFFLLPIGILSILVTIYAYKYFDKNTHTKMASFWSVYQLLLASMIAVVVSKSNLLFLLCWELMGLSSFFLVLYENEKTETRRAAWIYFSITHIGTFAIIAFFILSEQTNFRMLCFLLALFGFGSKAGIMPIHIWLPKAHALAPSPVSAIMSGIMIKIGVYGFIRSLITMGSIPSLTAVANDFNFSLIIITVGMISGVGGVLMALAQHDIKRLLAYHSVENIGIIYIGIGLGFMGISTNNSTLALLGFAGGLLHVLNHALFKGLLFLSAGNVISITHTHKIDKLGGLIKVMPLTAFAFFIGAISISGIPPFNGFVSEFLIYLASFKTLSQANGVIITHSSSYLEIFFTTAAILSLAIIGGLALFCFTKIFSIVFLGEMRSKDILSHINHNTKNNPKEGGKLIMAPQLILVSLCTLIGFFPIIILPLISKPLEMFLHSFPNTFIVNSFNISLEISSLTNIFQKLTMAFSIFALILLFLLVIRIKKSKNSSKSPTWDCGYHAPTTRMQYSASSFAATLVNFFSHFVYTKKDLTIKQMDNHKNKYFWDTATFHSENLDIITEFLYRIPFHKIFKILSRFTVIQNGKIHFYLLYIIIFLIIMISWSLFY